MEVAMASGWGTRSTKRISCSDWLFPSRLSTVRQPPTKFVWNFLHIFPFFLSRFCLVYRCFFFPYSFCFAAVSFQFWCVEGLAGKRKGGGEGEGEGDGEGEGEGGWGVGVYGKNVQSLCRNQPARERKRERIHLFHIGFKLRSAIALPFARNHLFWNFDSSWNYFEEKSGYDHLLHLRFLLQKSIGVFTWWTAGWNTIDDWCCISLISTN